MGGRAQLPQFDGVGGNVYYRAWTVPYSWAVVVLVHGHGEHSGHYHRFAAALNHRGIDAWGLDLPGHGLTYGERGIVTTIDALSVDGAHLMELARASAPDLPLVLVGHGLGGVTAATIACRNQSALSGLVLTGTPLRPFPRFVEPPVMSRDPFYLDELRFDPLGFDREAAEVSLRAALTHAYPALDEALPSLHLPVLFINGAQDEIAPPDTAASVASLLPRGTTSVFDGAGHDVINETVHADVAAVVADFVVWVSTPTDSRSPE
jgi:alpha-beta hydrolase superfamily lysophospholipase